MITHSIHAPLPPSVSQRVAKFFGGKDKVQYPVGSEAHKNAIFQRSITNHNWIENEYCVWRKTGQTVFILHILGKNDFDLVEWDGMKPLFIEIYLPDDDSKLVHPSDLREIK